MTDNSPTPTYCAAPFVHIFNNSSAVYNLCCHARDPSNPIDVNDVLPFDYFFSDYMEDVRDKMLSGEKVAACQSCYDLESRGFRSHRQWKYNANYQARTEVLEHSVSIKMRVFGSMCNLSCYMCHPRNSSERRKEVKQLDQRFQDAFRFSEDVQIKSTRFDEIIENILNNIKYVGSMHITGGEPLLLQRHWSCLSQIPDNYAQNIKLTYDTNLTVTSFKGHTVDELEKRFAVVRFGVSCDHYGSMLAAIRANIDVQQFERNLQECKHLIAGINVTVSIANVDDLDDIVDYYQQNFGIPVSVSNVVRNPRMLSIRNLTDKHKDRIRQQKSINEQIEAELSKDRVESDYQLGLDYCKTLTTKSRNLIGMIDVT